MSEFEFTKPRKGAAKKEEVKEPVVVEETAAQDEKEKPEAPEKPKYDKDELLRIFDEIIFQGEYVEEVTIRGKLKVQFKTRTAEEIENISKVLDSNTYQLVSTLNEARMLLNLQYALVYYQGKKLAGLKPEDKSKFIRMLPGPVIAVLIEALFKFDEKVQFACTELEANF